MAEKSTKPTMLEAAQRQSIKPGTPEMEAYLGAGYGMSIKEAEAIVAEWEKDHKAWPLEEMRKARAMLEAYRAKPVAIDRSPAWTNESHLEG